MKKPKKVRAGRMLTPRDVIYKALKALPERRRRTYRHATKVTGISVCALCKAFQHGDLKRRASKLRPRLPDRNKLERLRFAFSFVDSKTKRFWGMDNYVFEDEKWFYLKDSKYCALLLPRDRRRRMMQVKKQTFTTMRQVKKQRGNSSQSSCRFNFTIRY